MAWLASTLGAMLIVLSVAGADPVTKSARGPAVAGDPSGMGLFLEVGPGPRFEALPIAVLSPSAEGLVDESGDWEEPVRLRAAVRVVPQVEPTIWFALRSDSAGWRRPRRPLFLTCRHFEC